MKSNIIRNKDYITWLTEIKAKIRNAQIKAAVHINTELIILYWDLGKMIVEKQAKAKWGDGVIAQLSKDLLSEFPEMTGFSLTNLKYIRKWFLFYSGDISQQLVIQIRKSPQLVGELKKSPQLVGQRAIGQLIALIPWGHNREIITKCKDMQEAVFYVMETITNSWSRSVLVHQMESNLYKRQGNAINNFEITLPAPQSDLARETLKNPYNFDFLSLGKEMQERDLENALIRHIKKFMLELGKGYAYVGNQYNLTVEEDDFFLDLLFFNYHLNCFVVLELKVGNFKAEYTGKLNSYINIIDAQIKGKEHKPTIGILLCKTPNETIIKYSLQGINTPMGVANYQLGKALPKELKGEIPSIQELEQELEREVEELQNPVDKKMNRLKNLLNNLKTEQFKERRNPANIQRIFKKVILPLRDEITCALANVSKMFDKCELMIWTDRQGHKTEKEIRDYFKKYKEFNEFRIEVQLRGFKPASTKAFDVWKEIVITMNNYHYIISTSRNQQDLMSEKLYHLLPSKQEINTMAEKFHEIIIDDITQQVERIKQI